MKKIVALLTLSALIVACGGKSEKDLAAKPTLEEVKASIKKMEDSLEYMSKDESRVKEVTNLTRIEYINRLRAMYYYYPENEEAPVCLDKIHMVYSSMGTHPKAVAYLDTLIEGYPEYKNRAMVLESQASNYDVFIEPRDSAKVRFYYNMLLKEFPNLDKEKKSGIRKRLQHNHLTFDQYIELLMEEVAVK